MTVGVRVIFSLFVNMENKLSSLGTKRTSSIRNDSTDWVQNDLVGYEMTTYKGSLLSKRSYYMQPCILNGQILDIIFFTVSTMFCCNRVKEDNEPFHLWFLVFSELNESELHGSK